MLTYFVFSSFVSEVSSFHGKREREGEDIDQAATAQQECSSEKISRFLNVKKDNLVT